MFAAVDQAAWGTYIIGGRSSIEQLKAGARASEAKATDPDCWRKDYLAILRGLRLTSGYTG